MFPAWHQGDDPISQDSTCCEFMLKSRECMRQSKRSKWNLGVFGLPGSSSFNPYSLDASAIIPSPSTQHRPYGTADALKNISKSSLARCHGPGTCDLIKDTLPLPCILPSHEAQASLQLTSIAWAGELNSGPWVC